ncbi:MAG TPA: MMPL family transporter, partial [Burkholderiales bacterium]|nr:MMPL family transporter [Burkholderiales bacterium]
ALPGLQSRVIGDLPETLGQFRAMLDPAPVDIEDIPSELRERYIAADGRARIEVFPKQDIAGSAAMRRFVRAVQQLAPNAIGAPVELVESADAVILACLQATALALIATVALLALVMRSVVDALLVIVPLLLALALTLASSVLFDLPFNFANIIALPLLVALNNAFGIYLVTRRRTGIDFAALFKSSTPRAVLFSGLTTLVSFGALAVANHPGISSMGVLIALSLSYALAATLIVLPALMAEIACARSKR